MKKVVVIKEHTSNYPNPIHFKKGDRLQLGELDNEFEGWIRVTMENQNEGWAPIQYIEFENGSTEGVAKCSYSSCEINTKLNEQLTVILELNGWYQVSNIKGQVGWVPIQLVQVA